MPTASWRVPGLEKLSEFLQACILGMAYKLVS